jgi:MATE family multidrug resistance protein
MNTSEPTEQTGLLQNVEHGIKVDHQTVTTEKAEAKFLVKNAFPVSVTFLLQYLLSAASIFVVGHLGKEQLAAMSLCSVTAGIIGFACFQGMATAIDTLGAQAYGRGEFELVGVQVQRCTILIFLVSIPINLLWWFSVPLLSFFVPQREVAEQAGMCLRVLVFGTPGYILFEVAKHYLQVQGIFHASTYVLLIGTPFNIILNYILVWDKSVGLGLIGAPIAIVITDWTIAVLSILYITFIDGNKCWGGFSRNALKNWKPMLNLAIPGVLMVEAEWLAFEVLTLLSARLGTTVMAAQSILGTMVSLTFQVPLSLGITASTRVANFIGGGYKEGAKTATRVSLKACLVTGAFNASLLYLFRYPIANFFTSETDVAEVVSKTMPLLSLFQLNDSLNAVTSGLLRGQGRQAIGGIINLIFYYFVMLPTSYYLAFHAGYGLEGLWSGMVIGLFLVSTLMYYCVRITDWDSVITKQIKE